MTSEQSERDAEIKQAREILETTHGDLVRTAFMNNEVDNEAIGKAEGLHQALNVIEKLEHNEWDSQLATNALTNKPTDGEPTTSELQDLSRHVRENKPATQHPVVQRSTPVRSRGYWQLLKDILGARR